MSNQLTKLTWKQDWICVIYSFISLFYYFQCQLFNTIRENEREGGKNTHRNSARRQSRVKMTWTSDVAKFMTLVTTSLDNISPSFLSSIFLRLLKIADVPSSPWREPRGRRWRPWRPWIAHLGYHRRRDQIDRIQRPTLHRSPRCSSDNRP